MLQFVGCYIKTDIITPAASRSALKYFPTFYGTKTFITVFILSQINPVHITPSYLSKSHFNIILPSTSMSFPSGCPTKILYAFFFAPMRAIYPANFVLRDLCYNQNIARPRVAVGDRLLTWWVAVYIPNKQSRRTDKRRSSRLC
jgi:hypothetical protein